MKHFQETSYRKNDNNFIEETSSNPYEVFLYYENLAQKTQALELQNLHIKINQCVVSTVSSENIPHSRVLLMKGKSLNTFLFYSHTNSQKGKDIKHNPFASLLFFWPHIQKQIIIQAKFHIESGEEYFKSRPKLSQIASFISRQSEKVDHYQTVENEFQKAIQTWEHTPVPTPKHWMCFVAQAYKYEFFTYGSSRLNRRVVFELDHLNQNINQDLNQGFSQDLNQDLNQEKLWNRYTLYP